SCRLPGLRRSGRRSSGSGGDATAHLRAVPASGGENVPQAVTGHDAFRQQDVDEDKNVIAAPLDNGAGTLMQPRQFGTDRGPEGCALAPEAQIAGGGGAERAV